MVNTFFTHSDPREVFKSLDKRRLGKQRVEAKMILNLLTDAIFLSDLFNWRKQPTGYSLQDDIDREAWFKETFTRYLALPFIVEKDGRLIKGGWFRHPMVLMWVGYEEALKEYMTLCIEEWVKRGYQSFMEVYSVQNPTYPWWTKSESLHNSHRSALVRKERIRNEKEWYWINPDFLLIVGTEWYYTGYLWIPQLSLVQREKVQLKVTPEYCVKQTNDFVSRPIIAIEE